MGFWAAKSLYGSIILDDDRVLSFYSPGTTKNGKRTVAPKQLCRIYEQGVKQDDYGFIPLCMDPVSRAPQRFKKYIQ
jgi:hypothetical protein